MLIVAPRRELFQLTLGLDSLLYLRPFATHCSNEVLFVFYSE
jgi:hypothetical protein